VQFPLYVILLHLINIYSGLNAHLTVITFATIIFGIFAISVFLVARRLLELSIFYSIFLTIFVIFQLAVLREAWDLHRDIFALSTMLLTFSLIGRKKENLKIQFIPFALSLSAITAIADGMIGALFITSLIIYAFITKIKIVILCGLVGGIFFTLAILPHQNMFHIDIERFSSGLPLTLSTSNDSYNQINLLILFGVINGLLIPPSIIGFKATKNRLLKIPTVIVVVASFSWVVFPTMKSLVADRWIILSGVFLAVFAAYGIIYLIERSKLQYFITGTLLSILGIFGITGIMYAITDHDAPFVLYTISRNNIETFVPLTMQVNSVTIKDSYKMINALSWINHNTDQNSVIIGNKDWRGWMEISLKRNRTYTFSENLSNNLFNKIVSKNQNVYLITDIRETNSNHLSMIYSNDKFYIYKLLYVI
jgi:hypothetical protein